MHEWITLEKQCCNPLCSISNQFEFSDCPKIHLGCDMPLWHAAGVSIFSQYCQYCDMHQVWVFSKTKLNDESSPTCGGLTKAVASIQYNTYIWIVCVTILPISTIFTFRMCYYLANIYIQSVLLSGETNNGALLQCTPVLAEWWCQVQLQPLPTYFLFRKLFYSVSCAAGAVWPCQTFVVDVSVDERRQLITRWAWPDLQTGSLCGRR